MSKIAPPDRRSIGFQTRLERRFTPGRFGEIGYTATICIATVMFTRLSLAV